MVDLKFWRLFQRDAACRPAFLELRSSKGFIVSAMTLAVFTDIFLYGLVIPVFPFALQERANIRPGDVQMWVSVLLAVYGGGLLFASPICGYLADVSSTRRSSLLIGLFALAGATVLLCVGSSIAVLVAARLLQGVSAAMVWTVGLALIVDTVEKDEIAQTMGIMSAAMSLAILLGPLLGGVVYDRGGYYAVFAMAFALLAIDVLIRLVLIEKKIAKKYLLRPQVDSNAEFEGELPGPQEGRSGSPLPVGAGSERGSLTSVPKNPEPAAPACEPKTDAQPPAESDVEPGAAPSVQRKHSKVPPIIRILGYPRLLSALWGTLVQAILMTSLETTIPLRVREIFGFSASGAGLIFLAIVIPTFSAPVIGWVCDKHGPRWVAAAGFILACPSMVFLRFPDAKGLPQIVLMCAVLAFFGFSIVLMAPPLMAEITHFLQEVEEKEPGVFGRNGAYAQGYGLFNVAFSGGTLIGPLWAGFTKDAVGWNNMVWTLGLLSVVTTVPIVIYTGGKISRADLKPR